jgi:hypothetical protein
MINKTGLLELISMWNGFLNKKVNLIACGGTALTLLGLKPSTKDIDLVVPVEQEYDYLLKVLAQLGYSPTSGVGWVRDDKFIFDLFRGKKVHTTELLESPLVAGNNTLIKEFSYLYLGVLNDYDLIISKLFRGSEIDFTDCLTLAKARGDTLDRDRLEKRFRETASYDVNPDRMIKNLESFPERLKKEGGRDGR